MKVNVNRLIKKLIMLACIIYFVITIYNQQKVLNENSNSLEYIEKIAREKLQMYKPNEKVYKDK